MGTAARKKFYIRNLDSFSNQELSQDIVSAKRVNGHFQTGKGDYIAADIFNREWLPFEWYLNKNFKIKKGNSHE
jgi:hypothetical protein